MFFSLSALLIAFILAATPEGVHCEPIQWQSCTDPTLANFTSFLQCANLSVPLDYTNPTSTKLTIPLAKVPATVNPSNRSIILNFGGPGEPDRFGLAKLSSYLLEATGNTFDLISFDTRGTNNVIPFICYPDETSRDLAEAATPSWSRASNTALGLQWADAQVFAEFCATANNETGAFIGTAFAARDMMQIVDALQEDGLLRYYGLSYGTILGATFSVLFPDKVDRLVLDGVVNPFEYYRGYDIEKYTDTDKVFSGFVSTCLASPDNCALAEHNLTPAALESSIIAMLEDLKFNPIVLGGNIIDYSTVKDNIFETLSTPRLWKQLATGLHGVMTKNLTEVLAFESNAAGVPYQDYQNEFLAGIECGDKTPRVSKLTDIQSFVHELYQKSYFSDIQTEEFVWCVNWKLNAKERYSGDFHVKTRNPIMLIGNTWDPITPLVSAFNLSQGLQGSVVLQHNGYGHTSIQQPSNCTISHITEFFANGTLPKHGLVCQPDDPSFGASAP